MLGRLGSPAAVCALLAAVGCAAAAPRSHALNPLGWPSKGLLALGFTAADSELLLIRETGRLLYAVGELIDAPALLIEGVSTASGEKITGSGKLLVVGTSGTLTAAVNLPFFMTGGRSIDIGAHADQVNDALAYLEARAAQFPGREPGVIFPVGTRVRRSGNNLIWRLRTSSRKRASSRARRLARPLGRSEPLGRNRRRRCPRGLVPEHRLGALTRNRFSGAERLPGNAPGAVAARAAKAAG